MNFTNPDDEQWKELNTTEEKHLMKKFNDYIDLEKKFSKNTFLETSDEQESGKFGKKFIISSMIQGAITTGIIISLLFNQIFEFNGNFNNMLEFSFLDPNGLFLFGFMLQIGLTVGLTVIGIFYNHIETNLNREYIGKKQVFPTIHLFGINIFGSIITLSLIAGGIATSDLYQIQNPEALSQIPSIIYISAMCFVSVLTIGIIRAGINFIKNRIF